MKKSRPLTAFLLWAGMLLLWPEDAPLLRLPVRVFNAAVLQAGVRQDDFRLQINGLAWPIHAAVQRQHRWQNPNSLGKNLVLSFA